MKRINARPVQFQAVQLIDAIQRVLAATHGTDDWPAHIEIVTAPRFRVKVETPEGREITFNRRMRRV